MPPISMYEEGLMSDPSPDHPLWRKPSGAPVSCIEKIKVLNQNYAELRGLALDALEDALLMGCSEAQFRAILHEMIEELTPSVRESHE